MGEGDVLRAVAPGWLWRASGGGQEPTACIEGTSVGIRQAVANPPTLRGLEVRTQAVGLLSWGGVTRLARRGRVPDRTGAAKLVAGGCQHCQGTGAIASIVLLGQRRTF